MDIRPMTVEEAKDHIKKFYGNYHEYRRATMNYADAEREVVDFEIKHELRKHDGDVEKLVEERPDLYQDSRRMAIRVGRKIKE